MPLAEDRTRIAGVGVARREHQPVRLSEPAQSQPTRPAAVRPNRGSDDQDDDENEQPECQQGKDEPCQTDVSTETLHHEGTDKRDEAETDRQEDDDHEDSHDHLHDGVLSCVLRLSSCGPAERANLSGRDRARERVVVDGAQHAPHRMGVGETPRRKQS